MKLSSVPMLLGLALGGLLLSACDSGDEDKSGTSDTQAGTDTDGGDDADAELVDELEGLVDGYEGWSQLDDWQGIVLSEDGTHGDYVQIWYNDIAFETVQAGGGGDMPDGAILVKQGYSDEGGTKKLGFTAMWKNSDYDGSTGWFWVNWSSDGEVNASGEPGGCTGCHAAGQDYVTTATW